MAENEQEVNGSSENNESQPPSDNVDDESKIEMSGWLMKRTKVSHKWKKRWFQLKNTELLYGDSSEDTPKRIPLEGSEISETTIDNKDNAFRLKPKDSKRVFYLHAENEDNQHNWMQAICFAKVTGRTTSDSEACVLQ